MKKETPVCKPDRITAPTEPSQGRVSPAVRCVSAQKGRCFIHEITNCLEKIWEVWNGRPSCPHITHYEVLGKAWLTPQDFSPIFSFSPNYAGYGSLGEKKSPKNRKKFFYPAVFQPIPLECGHLPVLRNKRELSSVHPQLSKCAAGTGDWLEILMLPLAKISMGKRIIDLSF